jgi:membrane-bound lytic murein transglycosylase D
VVTALLLTAAISFPADGLQERIGFWKAVFTEYGEDHLIFHDRHHVHLIYEIVDISALTGELTTRTPNSEIEAKVKQRIGEALTELSSKQPVDWTPSARVLAMEIQKAGVHDKPTVLAERIHVQRGIREKFSAGLMRYSTLGNSIESILKEEGISEHFAALPLIESTYLNAARSRTGAAGIWQFMPSTAREYMRVTPEIDERFDPTISTRSAARLLQKNYSALKSWPLAITAYNHGLAGMKRAKEECGEVLHDLIACYKGPSFGYASMNFYSEFVAALEVLNEHRQLSARGKTSIKNEPVRTSVQKYQVRKGDTLSKLSKQFATTPLKIMALNGMPNAHRLLAGTVILVPKRSK